jgi:hypothetical protein
MSNYYKQILDLKKSSDNVRKQSLFETIIREILPWSIRPPVFITDIDIDENFIYKWQDFTFLVDVQTSQEIQASTSSWIQLEQKLEKKSGSCIGLLLSLYPVNENVIEAAKQLNERKLNTIILHGQVWDELYEENLPFDKLIHYLIIHIRTNLIPIPPLISEVQNWFLERDTVFERINELSRNYSATFLRRHKNSKHSHIYVSRHADDRIDEFANSLKPTKLLSKSKERQHKEIITISAKRPPEQICIIRDASGAGKTTLAVQIALSNQKYFGVSQHWKAILMKSENY